MNRNQQAMYINLKRIADSVEKLVKILENAEKIKDNDRKV